MKKFLIFSLISLVVTVTSLSYINYALLSDSSVSVNIENSVDLGEAVTVGYLSSGYSSPEFNDDFSKAIFLCNDLLYIFNLSLNSYEVLGELSFIKDAQFIDTNTILYVSDDKDGISLNIFNLNDRTIDELGTLSYRYFTNLNNVKLNEDALYFDIEYVKDGVRGAKSYYYKNNQIKSNNSYLNKIADLNVDDNYIYTTETLDTYINNSLFSYNNSSKFEVLGKDTNDIVYLMDKENDDRIISIAISENIEILEEYNLGNTSYNKILCTDSVYLIGDTFAYDIKNNKKLSIDTPANILLIIDNTIFYEQDGELLKQSI